jgi:hypothetical protein
VKKNLRLMIRLAWAAAFLAGCGPALKAGTVTRTYQFTAGDFAPLFDPASIVPYPTVSGKFTLTFDPLVSKGEGTDGIALTSLSIPLNSPPAFRYDYIDSLDIGVVQIGGSQQGINVTDTFWDDFYLSFQWMGKGAPHFGGFLYTHGTVIPNEAFNARSGFVRQVPEPASWALMIGGLGLVGGTLRQRRAVATI